MHMSVFVYLFLFSKIFMSKYNIYIFFLKCLWELWDKNGKKCRKVKKKEKYRDPGKVYDYFCSIFPPLLRLLHFLTTRLRLGQDLGVVSSWKQSEKGVVKGKNDQNGIILASFFFFFKGTSSKTTSFWHDPFKIKMAKTPSFWSQKIK